MEHLSRNFHCMKCVLRINIFTEAKLHPDVFNSYQFCVIFLPIYSEIFFLCLYGEFVLFF